MMSARGELVPNWALPLVVLALVSLPILGAWLAGVWLAALLALISAALLLAAAARPVVDAPIEAVDAGPGEQASTLVVLVDPLNERSAHELRSSLIRRTKYETPHVVMLAPRNRPRLSLWLSGGEAWQEADERLERSLKALDERRLEVEPRVADANPVLAVEDAVRTEPVREVVLVGSDGATSTVERLRRRLDRPVRALTA